jgi:hypothetical protein
MPLLHAVRHGELSKLVVVGRTARHHVEVRHLRLERGAGRLVDGEQPVDDLPERLAAEPGLHVVEPPLSGVALLPVEECEGRVPLADLVRSPTSGANDLTGELRRERALLGEPVLGREVVVDVVR